MTFRELSEVLNLGKATSDASSVKGGLSGSQNLQFATFLANLFAFGQQKYGIRERTREVWSLGEKNQGRGFEREEPRNKSIASVQVIVPAVVSKARISTWLQRSKGNL